MMIFIYKLYCITDNQKYIRYEGVYRNDIQIMSFKEILDPFNWFTENSPKLI